MVPECVPRGLLAFQGTFLWPNRRISQGLRGKETTMAKITRPLPPDNVTMRTHIIEACLPHLSLADVEALLPAVMQRLAALRETRRRLAQEAHYAQLRELPEGTLVEYIGYDAETFARG